MKIYSPFIVVLCSACLFCLTARGQEKVKWHSDNKKSKVSYSMRHPLHDWMGVSEQVISAVILDKSGGNILAVAMAIPVASFDSRNANRDSHMIEVLEGLKYPGIKFTATDFTPRSDSVAINGILTFHGVSRKLGFVAAVEKKTKSMLVSGHFTLNITDFGISPSTLLGLKCDENIGVDFDILYK